MVILGIWYKKALGDETVLGTGSSARVLEDCSVAWMEIILQRRVYIENNWGVFPTGEEQLREDCAYQEGRGRYLLPLL